MNGGPEDTPADSSWVTERILGISFCGIALNNADRAKAREIIKRTFLSYFKFPRSDPDRQSRLVALSDRRDSLLLQLVRTSRDTNKYLDQSTYFRSPRPASRQVVPL